MAALSSGGSLSSGSKSPAPLKIILDSSSEPFPKSSQWNDSERKLWTVLLFLMTTVVFSARTIVPLVAVNVSKEFGWDKTDTGLVLGSFFWGYPIAQIPGGMISDRIGGDFVIVRAAFIWGTVTILTPLVPYFFATKGGTIMSMTFLRFLMGLTQGVHFPSLTSLLSQKVSSDKRAYVLSCVFASSSLGTLLTGAIGSIIMEHSNWHYVFYFFGTVGIAVACLIHSYSRKQRRKTYFSFQNGRAGTTKEEDEKKSLPIMKLLTKRPFWGLLIGHSTMNFTMYLILSWMPTYFKELFPQGKGWVYNVLPWLAAMPASVTGGCLGDALIARKVPVGISRKVMHTISMFGMAFSLLCVGLTDSYHASLILMVIAVMSQACCNSSIPPNAQDIAPKHAGMVFGIMNAMGAVQGFVGTYIAGCILHSTGSWSAVFNMSAAVCLFGWSVFTLFAVGTPVV
ncbi:voltage-gated purine nucleotide uniporter SLC17A9-like isoform X2 [Diadema antillarum]|uniref:voltage-gated purine nucleotide uniporter SLC17A9-like isoform X2 n=1 Tax=Diadema antillarum TaxID=105358 RepID=UPI003A885D24